MISSVLSRLLDRPGTPTLLMDGGMGTVLEDRGVHCRSALWSSLALLTDDGLELNGRIHAEYLAAGAEILIANTHNAGASACRAFVEGDGPDTGETSAESLLAMLNRRAVESVRGVIPPDREILIAAGVGSAEGPYATESRHSPAEVETMLAPQVRLLRALPVDLILFETLTTESELRAVASLAIRGETGAFGAGLTCGPDGRTLAGVGMAEAWHLLEKVEPAAVFIQCTRYDLVAKALGELAGVVGDRATLGVYANDGREWRGRVWHGERISPEEYAAEAMRWKDSGARIVGGCCGTSPEHVAELRRRLARTG